MVGGRAIRMEHGRTPAPRPAALGQAVGDKSRLEQRQVEEVRKEPGNRRATWQYVAASSNQCQAIATKASTSTEKGSAHGLLALPLSQSFRPSVLTVPTVPTVSPPSRLPRKRPPERDLHARARGHHDVAVLGLDGALGADGTADDAADHRALRAAADHATDDGARGRCPHRPSRRRRRWSSGRRACGRAPSPSR